MSSRPKGIAVCIPSNGRLVHPQWAGALASLIYPVGQNHFLFFNYPDPEKVKRGEFTRSEQREALVDAALKANVEFIMWIDDDTIPPQQTILELFFVMSQNPNAAIVGGIYATKTDPAEPIVFADFGAGAFWQWSFGDVFRCAALGTGCMLVRTDVFRNMPKPWFKDTAESNLGDTEIINGQEVRITGRTGTDDVFFCKKVIEAGHTIIAHGGVLPAHMDYDTGIVYKIPWNSYPAVSYQKKLDEENTRRAANGKPPVQILAVDRTVIF